MDWPVFLVYLLACFGAGATGGLFPPDGWYRRLDKPGFTPPDWVFPAAWTYLYVASAWAAARVSGMPGTEMALALWAAQVAFNGLWSPVFFGLKRIGLALGVVGALWLLVAACLWTFAALDRWTLIAFVPYLAWVSVAFALNASIWRRNPAGPAPA
jgi:tryptophan-rich sensory protein